MLQFALLILLLSTELTLSADTIFWKHYALRLKNIGAYSATAGMMQCSGKGLRWLPIMDSVSNRRVQEYLRDNDIDEAWLGLIQTLDGRRQWMATRDVIQTNSYQNWAHGHPVPGYVYMDASTGTWKSEYSMVERTTLCVELSRSCDMDGEKYAEGDVKTLGCNTCTCSNSQMSCALNPDCITPVEGCRVQNGVIEPGESVDVGCSRCTCILNDEDNFQLDCTSCSLIDSTTGTQDETSFRLREQCPPAFADKGFRWVSCDEEGSSGCDKTCEESEYTCQRRCAARCKCPPEKPYLFHGFCKAECPGRRFAPVIIEGMSNMQFPEGGQYTVKCSAVGEPVPSVKISEYDFEPDLSQSPKTGQLGLRSASKTYTITQATMPGKVTCYAWNVNGLVKSKATYKVVSQDDTNSNPTLAADGKIRMPPMVRLGIESLALGNQYAQRMRCIVTGSPKPEVIIVKLKSGANTFPPIQAYAQEGIHDVEVEEIVMIDGRDDAGRYACLASNKYGAIKDIATLSYVEKPPTPNAVQMAMNAASFNKAPIVIQTWPFESSNKLCTYKGSVYDSGESFTDDCNVCTCRSSEVSCTDDLCDQQQCIDSQGNVHAQYAQWKEDCNTCTCLKDGHHFCTTKKCRKPYCLKDGKRIKMGQVIDVGCNKCVCLSNSQLKCSQLDCQPEPEPEVEPEVVEEEEEEEEEEEVEVVPEIKCSWFSGATYSVGEQWDHGCQACRCHESGRPICDSSGCGQACEYQGRQIQTGSVFEDDCRTCTCNEDGDISCEGEPCKRDGCIYNDQTYDLMQQFKDDCNVCMCLRGGSVACTKNVCMVPMKSCIFQKVRELKHGTQLQSECNLCTCNDGNMSCTQRDCGYDSKGKEGCNLEGEQRVYPFGSMIQLADQLCQCVLDEAQTTARRRVMMFDCS